MTLQEKFNKARDNFSKKFSTIPSFMTTELNNRIKIEIKFKDTVVSVGFANYSNEDNINDIYLKSMLTAIENYNSSLVP